MASPSVRVVVRLPWERPEDAQDPPAIDWNAEKADILWKTIEKSRARGSSESMDWKALATRLDVPLPYLLYRAHTRFQEELRGIQNMQSAFSPSLPLTQSPESPFSDTKTFSSTVTARSGFGNGKMSSSTTRLSTPLGVRARLTSLGHNSHHRPKKTASSSTLTVHATGNAVHPPTRLAPAPRPPSSASLSSSSSSESDEEVTREEAMEREAEEEELLDRKLRALQQLVQNDGLGLVSRPRRAERQTQSSNSSVELSRSRGRTAGLTLSQPGLHRELVTHRSASHSLSNTSGSVSESSPQGSIPDIPSPPPSQPRSPIPRPLTRGNNGGSKASESPPVMSPRSALGQPSHHRRHSVLLAEGNNHHRSSNHGSEASSFSDISDAGSLSPSALESALMSNIRGTGSKFSVFSRSRFNSIGGGNGSRGGGVPH